MKKHLLLLIFAISFSGFSQQNMFVFLKDKQATVQNFNETNHFSERSLTRRMNKKVKIDERDLPVNPTYLKLLATDGKVHKQSKWLNAVLLNTTLSSEELMQKYPFIERIQVFENKKESSIHKNDVPTQKAIDYGLAQSQIEQLNLNCLHDQGYTGNGIYLAIIDAGFTNMNNVSYFDSVFMNNRVLDNWDFPLGNSNVYANSSHGTMVASCIVGEKYSTQHYVGTAKDVDLALYRSEVAATETISEEFDLVLALERCDSVGVDIASISLGYFGFDDTTTNHVYADMDGKTTIAAVGVNVAASKGIAVIIAAGNGGPGKISTPCDADSCLCIGAVDSLSDYAFFSSVGPSSDGQIKPDVVARGFGAWVVTPSDTVISGNGTSFATPITSGATACLMQANPTKSVQEIFDAIRQSADQSNAPDSLRGYGLPDFCLADQILKGTASLLDKDQNAITIFPNPATNTISIKGLQQEKVELTILNTVGQILYSKKELKSNVINISNFPKGIYILNVTTPTQKQQLSFIKF